MADMQTIQTHFTNMFTEPTEATNSINMWTKQPKHTGDRIHTRRGINRRLRVSARRDHREEQDPILRGSAPIDTSCPRDTADVASQGGRRATRYLQGVHVGCRVIVGAGATLPIRELSRRARMAGHNGSPPSSTTTTLSWSPPP
jgi:hypothetical protein